MDPMPSPTPAKPPAITHCTATRRDGNRCTQHAIRGTNVCKMHGGLAPQVREAAKLRLLEATDPSAAELVRQVRKGKTDADRRAAAIAILDRAGFSVRQVIEHSGPDGAAVPHKLIVEFVAPADRQKPAIDVQAEVLEPPKGE